MQNHKNDGLHPTKIKKNLLREFVNLGSKTSHVQGQVTLYPAALTFAPINSSFLVLLTAINSFMKNLQAVRTICENLRKDVRS
jgi:hypothetical protein